MNRLAVGLRKRGGRKHEEGEKRGEEGKSKEKSGSTDEKGSGGSSEEYENGNTNNLRVYYISQEKG